VGESNIQNLLTQDEIAFLATGIECLRKDSLVN